jgi:hypothetical protein
MLVSIPKGCNQCKCMTWLNVTGHYSLHGNGCNLQMQIVIYNDLLWKFISNSYYFRKIYFLWVTSLHPKFYMPIFLWDVESSPNNYTEKLIFAGIGTITLFSKSFIYKGRRKPRRGLLPRRTAHREKASTWHTHNAAARSAPKDPRTQRKPNHVPCGR